MLVVQMMKKDMLTEIHITKEKDKKNWKSLVTTFLELILINWISMIIKYLVEQVLTLLNQLKKTEQSTKKPPIDDLSKRLLELEFKSNCSIKVFKMDC